MASTTSQLIILVLQILILLLLLSPTPTIQYTHVYVTNELGAKESLIVHCQSKDDDLGIHHLSDGATYTWRFRPYFILLETLFWCYVAPVHSAVHVHFDAYIDNQDSIFYYKDHIYWVVNRKGVCIKDNNSGEISVMYNWSPGRN
ncbi:S-protein homolog 4 [Linum perenne]